MLHHFCHRTDEIDACIIVYILVVFISVARFCTELLNLLALDQLLSLFTCHAFLGKVFCVENSRGKVRMFTLLQWGRCSLPLLGGSGDLVSKVISTLIGVISNYKYSYRIYKPSY